MLRFAPSPTGDMHIGHLRVALLNYLMAKKRDEGFIIRIEDIDKEKNVEGKDQEILDIVALFGLEYSHVVYQSQNVRFHSAMALQLLHEKKAFSCFCSDEWLEKKKEEAKEAKKPYSYDDACRNLPPELVIDNTAPFSVRIARPDKEIVFEDAVYGELFFTPDEVDSFVIMHRDKTPTADFATAVDDMLSDISLVVRDAAYLDHTPKQIHVRNQLTYDKEIEYAHIPTLENADQWSIKSLLEAGYLPEAISNYLVSIGNKVPCKIFTLEEASSWFSLDMLTKEAEPFSIEKLQEYNKAHMKRMDATELSRYVGFADADIGELARLYVDEAATTKELKTKIAPVFAAREIPETMRSDVEKMAAVIKDAPYFENYADFEVYVKKEIDLGNEAFEKALRVLLTNSQSGPDIAEIYGCLKNYLGEIIK